MHLPVVEAGEGKGQADNNGDDDQQDGPPLEVAVGVFDPLQGLERR